MPTYEYECIECKHRFDAFQSITADPLESCEKCGKSLRRVIGAAGIIFKGSGFYVNDYKDKHNTSSSDNSTPPCDGASKGCGGCDKAQ